MVVHLILQGTGFTWFSTDEKSVNLMYRLIEMHIFGYQIGTVNMDRYHGSQISRALNFLGLRDHSL